MSKHTPTPGPWQVEIVRHADSPSNILVASSQGYICELAGHAFEYEQHIANARLIAEAPAMRDELIECRKVLVACKSDLKWFQPKGTETPEIDVLLERIDLLLAKIEGTDNG
jgi:hypothetical protein